MIDQGDGRETRTFESIACFEDRSVYDDHLTGRF